MKTQEQREKYNLKQRLEHPVLTMLHDRNIDPDVILFNIVDYVLDDVTENWTPDKWRTLCPNLPYHK